MKRFVIALPRANQNELGAGTRRSLLPTVDVRKGKHRTAEFLAKAKRQGFSDQARFSMTMIGAEWLPSGEGSKARCFILMSLQRNDTQIGFRCGAWGIFAELDE